MESNLDDVLGELEQEEQKSQLSKSDSNMDSKADFRHDLVAINNGFNLPVNIGKDKRAVSSNPMLLSRLPST